MSLRVESTNIHFHPGSEPSFAITTAEHTQGGWVVAKDKTQQQKYYDTAREAANCGLQVFVECSRFEDSGDDKRFYWETTNVQPNGFCDP